MGCDIHIFSETKIEGKWVCNEPFEVQDVGTEDEYIDVPYDQQFYSGRDYDLFGVLAGVRHDSLQEFEVKGFPDDASPEIKRKFTSWDCDAHTPSYITLEELKSFLETVKCRTFKISGMMKADQLPKLQEALSTNDPDWIDHLYPYCGWSTVEGYVNFEVDVPFEGMLGDTLKNWVVKLEAIDIIGDKRVVFWFDN
jgi:hypothetical protein